MAAVQYRATYRSILREISKSSIVSRDKRNRDIAQNIRIVFEEHRAKPDTDDTKFATTIGNAVTTLRSQRMYNELLERYNPLHDMSQEERTRATARRVGLDMPIEGKAEEPSDK